MKIIVEFELPNNKVKNYESYWKNNKIPMDLEKWVASQIRNNLVDAKSIKVDIKK